jgi:hypothetical protein
MKECNALAANQTFVGLHARGSPTIRAQLVNADA